VPTVANITILFSSPSPDLVIAQFGICPEITELTLVEREQAVGRTGSGAVCLVRGVEESLFAWELLRTTGSDAHLRELNESARRAGKKLSAVTTRSMGSEEDIYTYLGVSWVPPEMREGRDDRRNATVEPTEMLGDLHIRSTSFDGSLRVLEMVRAAQLIGHQFICFCDRVGGRRMDADLLDRRNALIDEEQRMTGITLLKGAEVDITVDGRLDAPPDLLEDLDLVIGSVNTRLALPPEDQEVRMLKALEDPNLDVLGHPTNRVVGLREGMNIDLTRIAERAAERKVALEINAHPDRLDLADNDAYKVYDGGAFYSLGTDAAYPNELYNWKWAVTMARKALLDKDRVLNSWQAEQLKGRAWRK
jgi:DNA polymerase (family 10)